MSTLKLWEQYALKTKESHFNLSFDHILGFLEFVRRTSEKFSAVRRAKDFVVSIRKIIDHALTTSHKYLVDKYVAATLNKHPPHVHRQSSTWDVNILLDYFIKLGPNAKIAKINVLAGKLILQLLLTQMCRSGEVAQLQLSTMRLLQGAVQFQLLKPTKTYTAKTAPLSTKLQLMTIREFEGNELLCPLTTLLSYIERTKFKRGQVDMFLFYVQLNSHSQRPAPQLSVGQRR